MLKKIGLILLAFVMLAALAGCEASCDLGDVPDEETAESGDAVVEEPEERETPATGPQEYSNSNLGFRIEYPSDWVYEEGENMVMFSGMEGSDDYFTTLNVQNLIKGEGGYPDLQSVFADLQGQLEGAGGSILSSEELEADIGGSDYPIIRFEGAYNLEGEAFRQLTVIIERADENVFHMISYTAPENLYENNFELALGIIETFDILR